ncbi:creatininase family protein [Paenibacillus mendelii]|uniref:Creatininase family protein n=1 Tax=Paenibacillus mendelii TaxID=206163 RepID=A0ABV6J4K6_9BACL|nr:creatininase family protein [Paenibacillus mendelii]MCQ6561767.1 creatininase family protein [Paenibacillus mendelii]
MIFHDLTYRQIGAIDFEQTLVVIPTGATEQHGPHLPTNTDTLIVSRLAERLERLLPDRLLLTPTMWLGHSPHHLSFGGTLSACHPVYIQMLHSICQSYIGMGAKKLWILNGHGGNGAPNQIVLQQLKTEYPDTIAVAADYWNLAKDAIGEIRESPIGGMGHACELETSLYLYLDETKVHCDLIKDDGIQPSGEIWELDMLQGSNAARIFGFDELTASGVFGQPTLATKDKGRRLFEAISERLEQFAERLLQIEMRVPT